MLTVLVWSIILSVWINGVLFLIAFARKSDKLTDASYALSFILLGLFIYTQSSKTRYAGVGVILVCLWALRIGGFLLYRVLQTGKDRRFDGVREHFWQFGKFWLGQAITVWVLMLPLILGLRGNHTVPLWGIIIWLFGFVIESVADIQKYRFTHNPSHRNQWIDSGLWHYSRHPNYFGEIVVWIGIYAYCFSSLSSSGKIVGFISPLCITLLLLFVSGIPPLEKRANKRWGDNPAYQAYKHSTSILVPLPKLKSA